VVVGGDIENIFGFDRNDSSYWQKKNCKTSRSKTILFLHHFVSFSYVENWKLSILHFQPHTSSPCAPLFVIKLCLFLCY
jgi:hypothetical protein